MIILTHYGAGAGRRCRLCDSGTCHESVALNDMIRAHFKFAVQPFRESTLGSLFDTGLLFLCFDVLVYARVRNSPIALPFSDSSRVKIRG